MKLLVCCVPYDSGKSGISVYINNCVRSLREAGHDLTLIVEAEAAKFFPDDRRMTLPAFCRKPVLSMLYCLFVLPFRIRRNAYDRVLILAANRRLPAWCNTELYAVVHDLSQYHVPVKYDMFRMFYIKHLLPYFMRRVADVAIAISRSTACDLSRYWKIPADKIVVNYNGINRDSLPLGANDASSGYVLYVSRLEAPGKNHANLIRAWELLPESIVSTHKLVLAGSDWSGSETIHQQAENSPRRDSILFTGFVPEGKLHRLYQSCALYIFPSFFEGFGLSLVEAMASGAVVACSRDSSLGEIAGDAALTFDPHSPEEIARVIERGLSDDALRAELRERGLRREKLFDWRIHAARLTAETKVHVRILGCRISTGTMEQALNTIDAAVISEREHPAFFAFVNADCLNQAFVNPEYASMLEQADEVWADGVGVALAAKHEFTPVHDNVNGTDMLPLLCRRKHSLYLLGAAAGVAEKAKTNLEKNFPNLRILGAEPGFFASEAEERAAVERISEAAPDVLLVAMGVPRQERWILRFRHELRCRCAIGVGGLFDFASGRIPRAPLWLRRMKLEWVYRLYNEPLRLFRRYIIGNPLFLYRVWRYGAKGKNVRHG